MLTAIACVLVYSRLRKNARSPRLGKGTTLELRKKSLLGESDSSKTVILAPHTTECVFEDYGFRRRGSVFRSSQKTDSSVRLGFLVAIAVHPADRG